ncbi:MAG: ribosome small subunit-dependent GTPase A [Bacteroidaceae bacterium]
MQDGNVAREGLVVKSTGSWYTVCLCDTGERVDCKVKGSFRLKGIRSTNPVAVGDHVVVEYAGEGPAYIKDILERRNYIVRKASNLSKQSHILAANLDCVLLMVTIAHPTTSTTFIDRFLAGAEAYRVPVVLAFNKTDLYSGEEQALLRQTMALYEGIGYTCVALSAASGAGTDSLAGMLQGKVTLLSGNSGVGKSTLVNALLPHLNIRTAEISAAHDTGMHTTTFSEMYSLPCGGSLIDTPGIKGFGTFDFERREVGHYFREIFAASEGCRFGGDCTHTHEPGCAVRQALLEGRIAESRFNSYLSMLEDQDEGKYRAAY